MPAALPIEDVLPELKAMLAAGTSAVLQAPPGAGKTTRVPLALLDQPWLRGQKIVMLEPRKLAARAAAQRMAHTLGEAVGRTVGYRMRMDSRVGRETRIEVVTEGVLTRFLQEDPSLEGIGAILFDEFHERNLQSDLGLALTLESRSALREDLRILIMSATLESAPVAALLGNARVITSEGRSYPVETHYLEHLPRTRIEQTVASAVLRALREEEGDILVFLPGAGEIHRVEARLLEAKVGESAAVLPLYGNLAQDVQDRALAPSPPGRRKVVLATAIAETSLTIEGVRVVIDSGLMRVPRFSPGSGMARLETVPVSRASADQRRGRAGRLGPGVCYRLWTRGAHEHLPSHTDAEILHADLAPLALELAAWGVSDPTALAWLDAPPESAYAQAQELLRELEAIDAQGAITAHGRRMAELPLHPRLAHMVLRAEAFGSLSTACDLAALLSERDVFRAKPGETDVDVRLRLQALADVRAGERGGVEYARGHQVDGGALRRAAQAADQIRRQLRVKVPGAGDIESAGVLLALAYPDRVAQRRSEAGGRFRMRNGRSASVAGAQLLSDAAFLSIAHLDGVRQESRVYLAAPVLREDLVRLFEEQIIKETVVEWDAQAGAVRAVNRERLGAVVLREGAAPGADTAAITAALLEGVRQAGPEALPWTRDARRLQARVLFARRFNPAFPDVSDATLLSAPEAWLAPYVSGVSRLDELQRLDLNGILLGMLTWEQQNELDRLAPEHVTVPSGSRIPVDYSEPAAPALAVRLQEVFGMTETPAVAGGRVPLVMHLLSPARRPVQVTRDLKSFWDTGYFDVRKDLRGRYPKHYWPDNPLDAEPTARAKPRKG